MIRVPPNHGGWLEVICGPMFTGKSEEMIRRLRRAEIAGQRVVIFKPRIDDRYDTADVVSHAGRACAPSPSPESRSSSRAAAGHDVVGIDEAQFFDASVVEAALALADAGARVVAAGLDQDFRRLPFGPIPELLAHAEFVDKLQAVCHRCGGPATTTQRLVDGRPAPYPGETVVVGAAEQYEARCRDCHEPGTNAQAVAAAGPSEAGPTAPARNGRCPAVVHSQNRPRPPVQAAQLPESAMSSLRGFINTFAGATASGSDLIGLTPNAVVLTRSPSAYARPFAFRKAAATDFADFLSTITAVFIAIIALVVSFALTAFNVAVNFGRCRELRL